MSALGEKCSAIFSRFEKLSLRERLLVTGGAVVVLAVLWNSLYFQPLLVRRKALRTQIQTMRSQFAQLNGQLQALVARQKEDPNRENRRILKGLREVDVRLNARLNRMTVGLISPRQMPKVLEDLLRQESGLRLIKMKNLPPEPLLASAKGGPSAKPGAPKGLPMVYRHGLQMEFEGNYLNTLKYLQSVEGLSQRLFWDDFEFKVLRYPKARVTITVHTLNLGKGWIGV
jgi:MSHA biogenesis protein MshJ